MNAKRASFGYWLKVLIFLQSKKYTMNVKAKIYFYSVIIFMFFIFNIGGASSKEAKSASIKNEISHIQGIYLVDGINQVTFSGIQNSENDQDLEDLPKGAAASAGSFIRERGEIAKVTAGTGANRYSIFL